MITNGDKDEQMSGPSACFQDTASAERENNSNHVVH